MPQAAYYSLLINVLAVSVIVTILLIVIGGYISYRVAGSITRPILSLKKSVEKVQEGNFEIAVTCESEDEIGELGSQFNVMVVEIRNLMERIQKEHERQRHYEPVSYTHLDVYKRQVFKGTIADNVTGLMEILKENE